MTTDNKEPIKPKQDEAPDLTGNNEAGDIKTTGREYVNREKGKQNVPGVPVGNPVENTENTPSDQPKNDSDEDDDGDSSAS